MGAFKITGPDGKSYRIEGATAEGALQALQKHLGAAPKQQTYEDWAAANPILADAETALPKSPEQAAQIKAAADAERLQNDPRTQSTGLGAAANFLQGLPFVGSYADEAIGGAAGLISGEGAAKGQDVYRASRDRFAEDNSGTATALGLGGAVTGSLPAIAAVPALAGRAASSLGVRALQGLGLGTSVGAAEGAVYGYGAGDDGDRAGSAAQGGAIGAGLGGAMGSLAPVVAAGAGGAARWVLGRSANRNAAAEGLTPEATRVLTESLQGDDLQQGVANIRRAGPDAMPADAGPTVRALLDTAIQGSGRGGRIAREAVEGRASAAQERIAQALDGALGASQSTTGPRVMQATEAGIRQGTSGARSAAYNAAYAAPIDYAGEAGRRVEGLLGRVPGKVINKANELMQIEGAQSRQILAEIADDGSVTYRQMPDVRQLDYITRALNEVAQTNDGAGMLGGQTAAGRAYGNLSRDIRGAMREAVPEYGTALDTAADAISQRQALLTGQNLLRSNTTREDIADAVQGASRAELTAMRQGVRSQIDDAMANVQRTIADGNVDAREAMKAVKDLSSRSSREKMRMILHEKEADALFEQIERATAALELRAGVADNSKTYARQAMDRRARELTDGGTLGTLQRGEPIGAAKRIVQALTGRTPEAEQAMREQMFADVARALTEPRGPGAERMLRTLDTYSRQQPVNERIARALAARSGAGSALGGYQLGSQYSRQ